MVTEVNSTTRALVIPGTSGATAATIGAFSSTHSNAALRSQFAFGLGDVARVANIPDSVRFWPVGTARPSSAFTVASTPASNTGNLEYLISAPAEYGFGDFVVGSLWNLEMDGGSGVFEGYAQSYPAGTVYRGGVGERAWQYDPLFRDFAVSVHPDPAATITATAADTWTDWETIETLPAVNEAQAGNVDVSANIHAISSVGTGGGDRIYARVRIVRTRNNVPTTLVQEVMYIRNANNFGTNSSAISREASLGMSWHDEAQFGDVYHVEAQIIQQSGGGDGFPNPSTVSFDTANNGLFMFPV